MGVQELHLSLCMYMMIKAAFSPESIGSLKHRCMCSWVRRWRTTWRRR